MLRVTDLEKSIDFYCQVFGMQVIKRTEYPSGEFTLVFIGYGSEAEDTLIELTYNWGVDQYELGTAFGHIALEVVDIYKTCEMAIEFGAKVTRQPGLMKFGGTSVIAFVEDPNGYKIELIEKESVFSKMHARLEYGNT
jgi:lactoylglutathione lyase